MDLNVNNNTIEKNDNTWTTKLSQDASLNKVSLEYITKLFAPKLDIIDSSRPNRAGLYYTVLRISGKLVQGFCLMNKFIVFDVVPARILDEYDLLDTEMCIDERLFDFDDNHNIKKMIIGFARIIAQWNSGGTHDNFAKKILNHYIGPHVYLDAVSDHVYSGTKLPMSIFTTIQTNVYANFISDNKDLMECSWYRSGYVHCRMASKEATLEFIKFLEDNSLGVEFNKIYAQLMFVCDSNDIKISCSEMFEPNFRSHYNNVPEYHLMTPLKNCPENSQGSFNEVL